MSTRVRLIERAVSLEWAMFERVKSERPAACQQAPDHFRVIRTSLFATWTEAMLASYVVDLEIAAARGRNLLTEKYARMGGLIDSSPPVPVIEDIVAVECVWQEEIRELYPALYARCCRATDAPAGGSSFAGYLRGELQTYGEHTLDLYHENVVCARRDGRNLARDALENLARNTGYRCALHAEQCLAG